MGVNINQPYDLTIGIVMPESWDSFDTKKIAVRLLGDSLDQILSALYPTVHKDDREALVGVDLYGIKDSNFETLTALGESNHIEWRAASKGLAPLNQIERRFMAMQIADECDVLMAVWDYRDTAVMCGIVEATKRRIPVWRIMTDSSDENGPQCGLPEGYFQGTSNEEEWYEDDGTD